MSEGQNIPKAATQPTNHWWYNASQAGVRNSPPTGMSGSPNSPGAESGERRFSLTSMLVGSGSPGAPPSYSGGRRDSLKNMYHMSDFGTPDN